MATLYVDKTHASASDAWTRAQNSETQPWLTVGRAADLAQAGDTVLVKGDGLTYSEANRPGKSWSIANLNPINSGTAANPIRFRPFEDHAVTIQNATGGGPVIGTTKDYVIWEGFTTTKAAIGWCDGSELGYLHIIGPGAGGAATDGSVIHAGIVCHQLGPATRIHHCQIEGYHGVNQNHCGIIIWQMSATGPGVIEDNHIHDCWTGIYTKDADLNNIYRRNWIHDTQNSASFFANNQAADAGFELYDNYFAGRIEMLHLADGVSIHDNYIGGSLGTFVTTVDTITNMVIYNNVRVGGKSWAQEWARTGNEFDYFDHNFYTNTANYEFVSTVLTLAQMQALGFELNSDDGILLSDIYDANWNLKAPYTTAGRFGDGIGPGTGSDGLILDLLDTTRYGPSAFGAGGGPGTLAPTGISSAEAFGSASITVAGGVVSGLLAYWSLDESSGNALDAHGSNDLTDVNTVGAGTGKISGARDFDAASSERFSGGDILDFEKDAPRTIACWINPSALTGTQEFLSKKDASGNNGWAVYATESTTGKPTFQLRGASGRDLIVAADTALTAGSFTHLAVTYSGTYTASSSVTFYLNGTAVGRTEIEVGLQAGDTNLNSGSLTVGARSQTTPTNFFDGLVDELAVWDRELTAGEVALLHNNGAGRSYAQLSTPNIAPSSIASAEAFGSATVSTELAVAPGAIASAEAFGTASVGGSAALLTGLVSYWPLDEASGNAIDAHGSNDLTDTNTVGSATGKVNGARDFETDLDEHFTLADNAALSITGDLTIACWVNLESKTDKRGIVRKWVATGQGSYFVNYQDSTDTFRFTVSNDGTAQVLVNSSVNPATGTWYFVCARHDTAADVISISVNAGTPATTAHSTGIFDGTAAFTIGRGASASAEFMDGLIDEVAVYNRVLSDAEVAWLYGAGNGRAYAELGVQQVLPPGIDGGAFGTASVVQTAVPAGIASAEALPSPAARLSVQTGGIASGGAFGTLALNRELSTVGITSGEAFGTPSLTLRVSTPAIGSAEAVGTPAIQFVIAATGVATAEAFGDADVLLRVAAASIASAETFGTLRTDFDQSITASGIASAEGVGEPTLGQDVQPITIEGNGVASAETFGTSQLNQSIETAGAASGETFGTPTARVESLEPSGIASAEAAGTPAAQLSIAAPGIESAAAFGTSTLHQAIVTASVTSSEAFGTLGISRSSVDLVGLPSAERFGTATVLPELDLSGFAVLGDPLTKPVGERDELVFDYGPWLGGESSGEKIAVAQVHVEPGIEAIVVRPHTISVDGQKVIVPYEIVGPRAGRRAHIIASVRSDNPYRTAPLAAVGIDVI